MDVISEYYYKETKLESGKIVIERGFINYEHIYNSLIARQDVPSNGKIDKMIDIIKIAKLNRSKQQNGYNNNNIINSHDSNHIKQG